MNRIALEINTRRNNWLPFTLRTADRLAHVFIVGQTGTGKTSLIHGFMTCDSTGGQGFCLIDPHGDLSDSLVDEMGEQVQLWDLSSNGSGLGYNPLVTPSRDDIPLVTSFVLETFRKQWESAWGARMEHLFRYALLALLENGNATLRDVMPMFINKEFRSRVLLGVTDQQVRYFWDEEYPAMNYRSSADGVAPIANKLGAFLAHPFVRNALCEPTRPIDFFDLIQSGKSLIVNLSKGKLGSDAANIVGGLTVSAFAMAAYRRQTIQLRERRPYFLYVDEFHSFSTAAFADMLSELRKYGLGLIATTQHTSRLSKEVCEAVFGNVGTLVAFRLGAADAGFIAKQFGHNTPSERDLVNLPNYEMYVKMMIDGKQTRPFSARTLSPTA